MTDGAGLAERRARSSINRGAADTAGRRGNMAKRWSGNLVAPHPYGELRGRAAWPRRSGMVTAGAQDARRSRNILRERDTARRARRQTKSRCRAQPRPPAAFGFLKNEPGESPRASGSCRVGGRCCPREGAPTPPPRDPAAAQGSRPGARMGPRIPRRGSEASARSIGQRARAGGRWSAAAAQRASEGMATTATRTMPNRPGDQPQG